MVEGEVLKRYELSLDDILPQIMETIIEVYGERHRKQIEDNFKRAYLNPYITHSRIMTDYDRKEKICCTELSLEFLKKLGEEINSNEEKNVKSYGTDYLSDAHKELLNTYMGSKIFNIDGDIFYFDDTLLETDNEYKKAMIIQKRCDLLKKLGYEVTPENYKEKIASPDMQEALAHIQKVYKIALECREEFYKFKEENKDYDIYFAKCIEYSNKELKFKYLKEAYRKILPLCSEEEQKNIQTALDDDSLTDISKFICVADRDSKYFSEFGESLISAFSEKNNEYIENGDWKGNDAKRERIRYFKSMGLDLGDDYDAYQKSEESKKLIPDQDLVKEILKIKEVCNQAKEREFFINTGNYEQCKTNLLRQGIKYESVFSIDFVKKAIPCVENNFTQNENGELEPFYPVSIPICGMEVGANDIILVHELLHVAEFSVEKIDENKYAFKSGLDVIVCDLSNESTVVFDDDKTGSNRRERRNYETLSENLHQQLAIKVTQKLHEKGIFILDRPEYVRENYVSTYEQLDVITQDIMKDHEETIIDVMMAHTLEEAENYLGKENLVELNNCVKKFRAIPYDDFIREFDENKDTELTRSAFSLIREAKTISDNITRYINNRFKINTTEIGALELPNKDKKIAMQVVSYDKELEIGGRTGNGE